MQRMPSLGCAWCVMANQKSALKEDFENSFSFTSLQLKNLIGTSLICILSPNQDFCPVFETLFVLDIRSFSVSFTIHPPLAR